MAKINPMLLAFIAGSMTSAGFTFEALDADSVGKDDIGGAFLIAGADILTGLTQSNDTKFDKGIEAANIITAKYLKSKGLPVATG